MSDHMPMDVVAFDGIPFIKCSCGKNPTPTVWLGEHWQGDRTEGERLGKQALADAQQRERERFQLTTPPAPTTDPRADVVRGRVGGEA